MTQQEIDKRLFEEIRGRYPERLMDVSVKEELLWECIMAIYKEEFEAISGTCKTINKTNITEVN